MVATSEPDLVRFVGQLPFGTHLEMRDASGTRCSLGSEASSTAEVRLLGARHAEDARRLLAALEASRLFRTVRGALGGTPAGEVARESSSQCGVGLGPGPARLTPGFRLMGAAGEDGVEQAESPTPAGSGCAGTELVSKRSDDTYVRLHRAHAATLVCLILSLPETGDAVATTQDLDPDPAAGDPNRSKPIEASVSVQEGTIGAVGTDNDKVQLGEYRGIAPGDLPREFAVHLRALALEAVNPTEQEHEGERGHPSSIARSAELLAGEVRAL